MTLIAAKCRDRVGRIRIAYRFMAEDTAITGQFVGFLEMVLLMNEKGGENDQ